MKECTNNKDKLGVGGVQQQRSGTGHKMHMPSIIDNKSSIMTPNKNKNKKNGTAGKSTRINAFKQ